ncbi:MAG TPA: selenocysteine-specific translation elongation factor [Vicinamibacterales bacterium]|nr:selenocysteine-specific translation elongation factor [Vicinamibacterales bacterium]
MMRDRSVVIGTAGHIDHGKSALVRALTGTDPDRLKEEQERGITIDLGFAHLRAGGTTLAFVDVPGHERFVKNMLAGAGGIDLAMLVIAADESVMPQTREHFQICRLLQVPAGLIVLTKADLADDEMVELAALEARELIQGSFLEGAPVVAVSARSGRGLDELRRTLETLAAAVPPRRADSPARLPVDRVFSVKGFGTVVTGTLVAGVMREGQDLTALPAGRPVKVRGMQVHGEPATEASAGHRLAVNLSGVDVADLSRGATLCEPGAFDASRRLDVRLELLGDARPLRHGARVRFHSGTSELLGRVALSSVVAGAGPAAEVEPGASAYARIRLEAPAVVTRGDRFIVRAYSPTVTIGGGVVLDPHPPRTAIRTPSAIERFRRLDSREDEAVTVFVEERGAGGLPRGALVERAGLTQAAADALGRALVQSGRASAVENLLVAPAVLEHLTARLVTELEAHHRAQPLSEGLPREEARERLFGRAAGAVFEEVLRRLAAAGRVAGRDRLALAGHQVSLSPEEASAEEGLARVYLDAGLAPPDLQAAATAARTRLDVAERVLKLLLKRRTLVKLDTLLFHAEALERLKAEVRALKGPDGPARIDVAAFKDRYGITRKYAIPLLEYLDRERVTRRVGEGRVVL